ncbi:MAG: hypothetical protein WEB88_00400 [Gemmatimonadota bacterium]
MIRASRHPDTSRRSVAARALVATAFVLLACGPEGGDSTVSDGSMASAVSDANVPRLELEEDLRIGSLDGPEEETFTSIGLVAVAVAPSDDVHVFDSRDRSIRVFAADGTHRYTYGGRGEGPGAFQIVSAIAVGPDSVIVFDGRLYHVFDIEGQFIDARAYEGPADERRIPIGSAAWTERGWLVTERVRPVYGNGPRGAGVVRGPFNQTTHARVFDPATGSFGPPFATAVHPDEFLVGEIGFLRMAMLSPPVETAISTDGSVFISHSGDYEVEEWHPDGSRGPGVTRRIERIPVTDEDMEAEIRRNVEEFEARGALQGESKLAYDMWRNDIRGLGHVDFRPIIGYLIADQGGRLLVHRADMDPDPFESGDASDWDVFDSGGGLVGRFTAAPGIRMYAYDHPFVYGTVRDEVDVVYLVRWRIAEPG